MGQNMRWSLNELYLNFQSESFNEDMVKLDQTIVEVKEWSKYSLKSLENPVDKIELFLQKQIQLSNLFSKLMSFAALTASVEAKNQEALITMDNLYEKQNQLTESFVTFEKWLASLE